MCNEETQQFIMTIIDHARTAKPYEFRFIRNHPDYRFFVKKRRSFKLLIKGLTKTSKRLFKKYCAGVAMGAGNFNQLLAYQQLLAVIEFYKSELEVFTDMVYEYEAYLLEDGNWFSSAILGMTRPVTELRDYRE